MNKFECPVCKTIFEEDDENNTAPFCSQNCRQKFTNAHKVEESVFVNNAVRREIDRVSKLPKIPMNVKKINLLINYLKTKRNGNKSTN